MLIGIESTIKTDSLGKWMLLCTVESEPRVREWIDKQLPSLYETATRSDPNYQTTDKAAFPAPSRGNFSKQAALMDTYEAKLRASLPNLKSTTDSQEDPAFSGVHKHTGKRPTKTRTSKEIKLVYDERDVLFPTLRTPGRKGSPAQAPGDQNTYSAPLLLLLQVLAVHPTTTPQEIFTTPVEILMTFADKSKKTT
jgi:hypothetical protein